MAGPGVETNIARIAASARRRAGLAKKARVVGADLKHLVSAYERVEPGARLCARLMHPVWRPQGPKVAEVQAGDGLFSPITLNGLKRGTLAIVRSALSKLRRLGWTTFAIP